ncbi:MAG TPA: hypothetical protein VF702_03285 [Allosphingosinicella sp.]
MKIGTIAGTALCMLAAGSALAAAPRGGSRDLACATIETVPGGRFTHRSRPGLSVLALARADGPFTFEHGGEVVGFVCLRRSGLPEVDEVEVLQAGFTLGIGGVGRTVTLIHLELKNGRIETEMLDGALDTGDERRLSAVVAGMQARVDAAR